MSIEVKKIAGLARLMAKDSDLNAIQQDLEKIVKFAEQIKTAETSKIKPLAHPSDEGQRLREDTATENDQRTLLQSIAPETATGLYVVPKVIEE